MSATTPDDENADFLHFYQKFKFEEDSNSHITTARSKRLQLVFDYYQSLKSNEREATSFLLKNDLNEYSKIVDDKTRLNNYAQYVKSVSNLSQHPVSDCKKWTSSLNSQHLRNIDIKCSDSAEEGCNIIGNIYFDMKKKFINVDQTINNQRESYNGKKTDGLNFQSKSYLSNQSTETASFSKVSNRSNDNRTNTFTFKKPSNHQPNYPQNAFNSNRYEENQNKISNVNNESSYGFRTANSELKLQNVKKYGNNGADSNQIKEPFAVKRSLGGRARSVNNKFVPPIRNEQSEKHTNDISVGEICEDERLKSLDPKLVELIKNEIMDNGNPITWDDIAGLQFAKATIQEIVVWPLLRPDIFTGLRRPPKGILLFGPPGTGKTLIGKCIASQSSSTFFSISASSLTSKWMGESEKLVRTLFAVARCYQPAVIFIDEIDSLLSQRSETEHESTRRIKTEFLVQLDGATTHEDDRILVIGATNRPQELDEAARRRLVKRLYIPLPEFEARCQIVNRLMGTEKNDLTVDDVHEIAKLTDGYSGADMKNLCQEASLGPIRSIDFSQIGSIESHQVRPVTLSDFISALKVVRSSVSPSDLNQYLEWDRVYGSSGH